MHRNPGPENPIGIFDSGVGGLTVVKAVRHALPGERILYFGDTARVPYGPKSQVTIRRYAEDDTQALLRHQPKMIIVACNTVSALALDVVEHAADPLPVLGVLEAGATLAVEVTKNRRIGVIGTQATVCSNAYAYAINRLDPQIEVFSSACPLFVPLAEEGMVEDEATRLIARQYLLPLVAEGIDTLVLGCTHYPILRRVIEETVGPAVRIIDSAEAVAIRTAGMLRSSGMLSSRTEPPVPHLMVSDLPQKFGSLYRLFMDSEMPDVELVEV
ncbi:MAG: glutamate racemase [Pelodictyon luteolum]|uniref:Glutamate racemase n=1 Tax=Pelodictyon luteolum TaxID=1100 RepID=A0A165L5W6_PELLU|nr:glutamate racemase [Pelodictyon luteolum]KZK73604.1 MAG: glutamate racemase [Pelodictyon luteolum]